MSVPTYLFHSLPLKLPNKEMDFPFPPLKLPNKIMKEYSKIILFIFFFPFYLIPSSQTRANSIYKTTHFVNLGCNVIRSCVDLLFYVLRNCPTKRRCFKGTLSVRFWWNCFLRILGMSWIGNILCFVLWF